MEIDFERPCVNPQCPSHDVDAHRLCDICLLIILELTREYIVEHDITP